MAVPLSEHYPHSFYTEISQAAWRITSDLASTLKDLIVPAIPNVTTKMPPTQSRRAACTHLKMSRLYGTHQCTHCNRPSRLGWVYVCTQDHHDHTCEVEEGLSTLIGDLTIDHRMKALDSKHDENADSHIVKLSSWMEEALLEGHYMPDQITILRAQRQKVKDCIAAAGDKTVRSRKVKLSRPTPVQTTNVTSNLNLPSLRVDDLPPYLASDEPQTLLENDNNSTSTQLRKFTPDCSYKTCQICRPASRDRVWECFEHIFQATVTPSSLDSCDVNRPISNAALVRRLGLRVLKPRSEIFGSEPGNSITNGNSQDEITDLENYLAEADSSRENTLTRQDSQKAGPLRFRASARRSIRSMLISPRRNSTHGPDSKGLKLSGRNKTKRDNALVKFIEDLSSGWRDSGEYDLGSCATQRSWRQDNGITVCTNTRSAFKDGNEDNGDELHVPNGVAVTEEAADLGTADVIMQV